MIILYIGWNLIKLPFHFTSPILALLFFDWMNEGKRKSLDWIDIKKLWTFKYIKRKKHLLIIWLFLTCKMSISLNNLNTYFVTPKNSNIYLNMETIHSFFIHYVISKMILQFLTRLIKKSTSKIYNIVPCVYENMSHIFSKRVVQYDGWITFSMHEIYINLFSMRKTTLFHVSNFFEEKTYKCFTLNQIQ